MKAKILKSKTTSNKPSSAKFGESTIVGVENALSVRNQGLLSLGDAEKKPAKKDSKSVQVRRPKKALKAAIKALEEPKADTKKKVEKKTTEPDALPIENYTQKTWYEFKNKGLLLFVNMFLHIFGWAICVVTDAADQVITVYPARTRYRGFSGESLSNAYVKLSEYIHKNHKALLDEARG